MVANIQESKSSETYYKATFQKPSPDYALTTLPDNSGNISVRIQVCAMIQNLDFTNVETSRVNSPKSTAFRSKTTLQSELPLLPELLYPSSTLLKIKHQFIMSKDRKLSEGQQHRHEGSEIFVV